MRRTCTRCASFLAGLVLTATADAEWSPDVRLTDDPAFSRTEIDGGRNVVVADQLLMSVWSDARDGDPEIYFRERIAGVWGPPARLTTSLGASVHPAIGRQEGEVRVVWEDHRTGHPEIRLKRKVFGVWLADSCLTCDEFESARPALDHTGEHLVWEETKDGNREIYSRRLPVEGPWEAPFRISMNSAESSHPCVASPRSLHGPVDPALRVVAWQDMRDGNWEIYARYGATFPGWGPEERVSFDGASSRFPSVAVEDDAFCGDLAFFSHWVAWQDDRDGRDQIYFAEGMNGEWQPGFRVKNTVSPARRPTVGKSYVAFFGPFGAGLCGTPAIAWEERGVGAAGAIVHLDFATAAFETLSAVGSEPRDASIAVFHDPASPGVVEGRLAVVWTDTRDGNEEIYLAEGFEVLDATDAPHVEPAGSAFELGFASPNPFGATTSVTLRCPEPTALSVGIVDAAGRRVRELFAGTSPAGVHRLTWNGTTASGERAAAGIYFLVAQGARGAATRQVVRLR